MIRVLIALDDSAPARRAVDYAAGILPHLPACEVLLLALAPGVPPGSGELDRGAPAPELHGDEDHRMEVARLHAALAAAAAALQAAGLPAGRIRQELRPVRIGVAEDLLAAADAAGCGTLVVGRRGLSRLRELLEGSVSSGLVHQAGHLAVWVVA